MRLCFVCPSVARTNTHSTARQRTWQINSNKRQEKKFYVIHTRGVGWKVGHLRRLLGPSLLSAVCPPTQRQEVARQMDDADSARK